MEENISPIPEPQKPPFSQADTLYAWVSLIAAYLFCDALPISQYPLYGFLLVFGLFVAGFTVLRLKKQKLSPVCILSALSALVISGAMLLTETSFLVDLSFAYGLASFCYFLYAALGNRIEEGFSDYIYIDFIKILFIFPFRSMGQIFPALSSKTTQKSSRFLLKALIGMAIAIIPTAIVFGNLSYDEGFTKILDDIFSFDSAKVGHIIGCLIFTLPLAMYGFGLYSSSVKQALHDNMNAESCRSGLRKTRILPQLTALVAVLPILFLYVVFFVSQWQYYVSGFTGVLPENFSYAEYARQGFFELCSVSVVNLILIVGISLFIKRGKQDSSVILKLVAVVFCLCTLILISTAIAKLVMYIGSYGLTEKRIYAMWLMVLIGIVFLLIAAGQFLSKLKVVAVSVCIAIVMFAGLSVCNINGLCARYNAEQYLSGKLEQLDISAMEELGNSAVPSLLQVSETLDPEEDSLMKRQIDIILFNKYVELYSDEGSFLSFNIPAAQAKAALKDYVPKVPPAGEYEVTSAWNGSAYIYKTFSTVTIFPDHTGSITYPGDTKDFRIIANKVLIGDLEFKMRCHYDNRLNVSYIRLSHDGEENSYSITLEPQK